MERDLKKAASLTQLAAQSEYSQAQANLGNCYLRGKGVIKDPNEALKWYQMAIDGGLAWGYLGLGDYYKELGDLNKSKEMYLKSLTSGNLRCSSGGCYRLGILAEEEKYELNEAIEWYSKVTDERWKEKADHAIAVLKMKAELKLEDLAIQTTPFGGGNFGRVFESLWKQGTSRKLVVKKINLGSEVMMEEKQKSLEHELELLKKATHRNIVPLLAAGLLGMDACIVMEMYDSSLKGIISVRGTTNPFQNEEVRFIIKSILKGLDYLHSHQIFHQNLKVNPILYSLTHILIKQPDNVLVLLKQGSQTEVTSVRLTDFGVTNICNVVTPIASTLARTPEYLAPEVYNSKPHNPRFSDGKYPFYPFPF